jgi:hypothetical protein
VAERLSEQVQGGEASQTAQERHERDKVRRLPEQPRAETHDDGPPSQVRLGSFLATISAASPYVIKANNGV